MYNTFCHNVINNTDVEIVLNGLPNPLKPSDVNCQVRLTLTFSSSSTFAVKHIPSEGHTNGCVGYYTCLKVKHKDHTVCNWKEEEGTRDFIVCRKSYVFSPCGHMG